MAKLSIWSIRLSLVYLVVGWGIGAVMMVNQAWGWSGSIWRLVDLHVALLVFGWFFQLVMGVAYWMLPTFGGRDNRGREWAACLAVAAVNIGVIWTLFGLAWGGAKPVVAVVVWLVGATSFGWHAWPRVKAFGK